MNISRSIVLSLACRLTPMRFAMVQAKLSLPKTRPEPLRRMLTT